MEYMQAIEVSHLIKKFGPLTALNDITFSVGEGETFGFLGPNGAGKTTTIRILTGISSPTSGTATIFGHDIERDTIAARQSMGIVSENSNVYDDLTAWQNMIFSAELYHVTRKEREKKTNELLTIFGLHERRNDKVHGFSKGMKRRLTLAMGLVNSPRLLFLDEPTSGLDVQSNLIIRDVVTDLVGKGVTVFLTTHNIEEANVMCDRVAIINKGNIAAIDAPERLKKTIQSVQSIEFSFNHNSADQLDELRRLPMVNDAQKAGDKFKLYTQDPSEVIDAVMVYAHTHNLKVISITTLGPSLEDVFIRLTGLQRAGVQSMPSIDPEGCAKRLSCELSAAWAIARKDMRIYYFKPNIIVSGILFPLFMFLAFATGKNAPPGTLIPGLISITLLFSASSIEPVSIPIERRVKTFDRLLSAPISLHSLVFGESLSGFLYSLGIACLPLAIGVIMFSTAIENAPVLVIAMILTSFCFATLGTLFAAYPTENVGEVMSMLNTVRLPLIFISGVFIPISAMPQIGQKIALISPLTYGNDMIEFAYTGKSLFYPLVDIVVLLIFILIFQVAANRLYKKFNE